MSNPVSRNVKGLNRFSQCIPQNIASVHHDLDKIKRRVKVSLDPREFEAITHVYIEREALVLECQQAGGIATRIRYKQALILRTVSKQFPQLQRLRVRMVAPLIATIQRKHRGVTPDAHSAAALRQIADRCDDGQLATVLRRLAQRAQAAE